MLEERASRNGTSIVKVTADRNRHQNWWLCSGEEYAHSLHASLSLWTYAYSVHRWSVLPEPTPPSASFMKATTQRQRRCCVGEPRREGWKGWGSMWEQKAFFYLSLLARNVSETFGIRFPAVWHSSRFVCPALRSYRRHTFAREQN